MASLTTFRSTYVHATYIFPDPAAAETCSCICPGNGGVGGRRYSAAALAHPGRATTRTSRSLVQRGAVPETRRMTEKTSPTLIRTGFGFDSTAAEVIEGIDLSGKRAIVTGGSSGIGVETARALSGAGADVTLAVRDTG